MNIRISLTYEQYDVPTGDAEEEAIASRALHSKEHKDFANCKYTLCFAWDSTDAPSQ